MSLSSSPTTSPSRRSIGNLELLQQHGAKKWIAQLDGLEAHSKQLEEEEKRLAAEIDAVNRKRKADQLAAAPVLAKLEADWVGLVKKNLEIEAACLTMEGAAQVETSCATATPMET